MSSIELINLSTDCLTKPPAESFSSVLRNAIPLPIGKLRRFRADNRQPALRLASVQLLKPATPRRVDHRRLNRSSSTFTLRQSGASNNSASECVLPARWAHLLYEAMNEQSAYRCTS